MSWHFSQALVEAFSEATCSDGERSAPSSGIPTPLLFCAPDRMTVFSRLSRFGMMCRPLTDDRCEELLTWFRAGFPVRTSASQERAPASTESDPECGRTWHASLARFDRDTSSWRTLQQSLLGDSDECSVTWPRSGMTADGLCLELPMSGRRTSEIGSGLWPTPLANDALNRGNFDVTNPRNGLPAAVKKWPTPTSSLGTKVGRVTPRKSREGGTLIEEVSRQMYATPNARDWKDTSPTQGNRKSPNLGAQVGGSLNPTWVEWLMGWPLEWTDLKPLATAKFRQWQQQHGVC